MFNKKIILITGSSDGVGKETAITLAKEGHTIIVHGRDEQKTIKAVEEIKSISKNQNIDMFIADFLSLQDVKDFAIKIKEKYEYIDVLINNAGAQFTDKRETTKNGYEKTMVINVFAPMLLTYLLIDILKKSQSARVITVSSDSHRMTGKVDINDIELIENYSMAKAYALSKLYIIWIMYHFDKVVKEKGINNITFNLVHPSSTMSNLGRESTKSLKWKIIYFLWKPMMVSIQQASSSSIYATTSKELEGVSGKYFGLKGEEKVNDKYYSVENEEIVWNYSLNIVKSYL